MAAEISTTTEANSGCSCEEKKEEEKKIDDEEHKQIYGPEFQYNFQNFIQNQMIRK